MSSLIPCLRACKITLVAFVICLTFPRCGFSNVSSNCLPQRMHNHIGCICLTFHHYAFWNVSSTRLHEMMQSHTGCTCSTFLQCVFANVSSNGLHERMHSHTDCTCLAFLHCVFSNATSSRLHKKVNSYIDCICLTFRKVFITLWHFSVEGLSYPLGLFLLAMIVALRCWVAGWVGYSYELV